MSSRVTAKGYSEGRRKEIKCMHAFDCYSTLHLVNATFEKWTFTHVQYELHLFSSGLLSTRTEIFSGDASTLSSSPLLLLFSLSYPSLNRFNASSSLRLSPLPSPSLHLSRNCFFSLSSSQFTLSFLLSTALSSRFTL